MKKADMFKADKNLVTRVSEFMTCKVSDITSTTRHRKAIEAFNTEIGNVENLRGSVIKDEDIDAQIDVIRAKIDAENESFEKAWKEREKFEWTDADNKFYKSYESAESEKVIKDAIVAWAKTYNLDIVDTDLLRNINNAIKGERNATSGVIIRSGAKQFTVGKRTKNDVMRLFYGKIAEYALAKGTLKPVMIPADIVEAYAKKNQ